MSKREKEVLELLAEPLSNGAIGERLFISVTTVKTHVRHILEKLDVLRRAEAVVRAREIGIM